MLYPILTITMNVCLFWILLVKSCVSQNMIRSMKPNLDRRKGIVQLKNITVSEESTICMKVKTFQYYQPLKAPDNKGLAQPLQVIFASEGYGTMMTIPAFDCSEFYSGCEAQIKSLLGTQWEYGKIFTIFQDIADNIFIIPAWSPGTLTRICLTRNESLFEVYYNGEKVAETSDVSVVKRKNTNLNLMNKYDLSMQMNGEVSDFNIWSSILRQGDIRDWSACENSNQGNILRWNYILERARDTCNFHKDFFMLIDCSSERGGWFANCRGK